MFSRTGVALKFNHWRIAVNLQGIEKKVPSFAFRNNSWRRVLQETDFIFMKYIYVSFIWHSFVKNAATILAQQKNKTLVKISISTKEQKSPFCL